MTLANSVESTIAMNRSFTKEWCRMAGWLLLLFTGLSLSGCQVAHMALPQDLPSESSELTVEGRQLLIFRDSFHFGLYHVTDIHRGWTRGEGFSISNSTSEAPYVRGSGDPRCCVGSVSGIECSWFVLTPGAAPWIASPTA